MNAPAPRLVIVTGLSGSGKSTALHALEDLGYYCVDNLPLALLEAFGEQLCSAPRSYGRAAVGLDVRTSADFGQLPDLLPLLAAKGIETRVVALSADERTLLNRYKETRRRHPLASATTTLADALRSEGQRLAPITELASDRIDTSSFNLYELRDMVRELFGPHSQAGMSVLLQSFGFKHGTPLDADLVFDVRCLPNPNWVPELRALTGRDEAVQRYLRDHPLVAEMVGDIHGFLARWLPRFEAGSRGHLNIAIGCTGGRHRSVYVAETLRERLQPQFRSPLLRHRELHLPRPEPD